MGASKNIFHKICGIKKSVSLQRSQRFSLADDSTDSSIQVAGRKALLFCFIKQAHFLFRMYPHFFDFLIPVKSS